MLLRFQAAAQCGSEATEHAGAERAEGPAGARQVDAERVIERPVAGADPGDGEGRDRQHEVVLVAVVGGEEPEAPVNGKDRCGHD